jgi:hypothetical protein
MTIASGLNPLSRLSSQGRLKSKGKSNSQVRSSSLDWSNLKAKVSGCSNLWNVLGLLEASMKAASSNVTDDTRLHSIPMVART